MYRIAPLLWLLAATALLPGSATGQSRAIAGQVQGPDGKPVAGATVRLISRPYPGLPAAVQRALPPRAPGFSTQALTNKRGEFRLEPKDHHGIGLYAVDAAGDMSQLWAPVLSGDYHILRLAPAARVRGTVTDGNKPAAGMVFVEIMADTARGRAQQFQLSIVRSVKTEADGSYEVLVPAGCGATVLASSRGRYTHRRQLTAGEIKAGRRWNLSVDGNVLRGQVLGPDARPLGGVLVRDPFWSGTQTRTRPDGWFELATHRNYNWVHVVSNRHAHVVYYIRPTPKVRLPRRAARTDIPKLKKIKLRPGRRLRARVRGPGNKPLANARLVLAGMPQRVGPAGFGGLRLVQWQHRLDDSGGLDISCMPQGHLTYVFVEVAGEFVPLFEGRLDKGMDLGEVHLPYASTLEAVLRLPDRTPARHVRVLLRRQVDLEMRERGQILPFLELITDRAGRLHQAGLRAGTYEVLVDIRGRMPFYTQVTLGIGDGVQQIDVPAGWRLRGQLVDEDGGPVPNGTVRLSAGQALRFEYLTRFGYSHASARTDKDGRFVFRGLPKDVTFQATASAMLARKVFTTRSWTVVDSENAGDEIELVLNGSLLKALGRRR